MTTRIKWVGLCWLLAFIMMVGLMPVIDGNVYAEVQNTDNSQGYGIESVQVENSSADVEFTTKSDALLFVAVYTENGQQKMLTSQRISSTFQQRITGGDLNMVHVVLTVRCSM